MPVGDVAQPQLDGVERQRLGQLVHRAFERQHAHRLARRTDRSRAGPVDARDLVDMPPRRPGIEKVRRLHRRLAEALARQLRDPVVMADARQPALGIGGEAHALARLGSAHRRLEDLLADKVQLPRAAPGDLIAIFQSGAYGKTASPTDFLSHPAPAEILAFDLWVMLGVALLAIGATMTGWRIDRREGVLFLAGYAAYLAVLAGAFG